MSATTKVSRLVKAPPEAVYRACTDLDSIVRWRVPDSMTGRVDSVDGATYRMSLTYPDGRADKFEATVVERVPNERIVERIRFDAAERTGEMTMTTSLRAVGDGTEVTVAYENLPSSIRQADNDEGTRQALAKLAKLVA
ncbi:SRPBCC domain-containing protein [Reyranella sp.]|uniref:SRPBCC domain-containing protein n=1 Tax=Reyranella sp. TaxID=1929291 RepID=UPI003D12475D